MAAGNSQRRLLGESFTGSIVQRFRDSLSAAVGDVIVEEVVPRRGVVDLVIRPMASRLGSEDRFLELLDEMEQWCYSERLVCEALRAPTALRPQDLLLLRIRPLGDASPPETSPLRLASVPAVPLPWDLAACLRGGLTPFACGEIRLRARRPP